MLDKPGQTTGQVREDNLFFGAMDSAADDLGELAGIHPEHTSNATRAWISD